LDPLNHVEEFAAIVVDALFQFAEFEHKVLYELSQFAEFDTIEELKSLYFKLFEDNEFHVDELAATTLNDEFQFAEFADNIENGADPPQFAEFVRTKV
jgi:hypothetical protein